MIRDYTTGVSQGVDMFVGAEVEHSPFYGTKTLFVANPNITVSEIVANANALDAEHIYLAANQSFDIDLLHSYKDDILSLTSAGFKVTIDIDSRHYEDFVDLDIESDLFCLMVSVKLPNIKKFKNLTVKLDDADFNLSNDGVWAAPVTVLLSKLKNNFTSWDRYSKDQIIGDYND